MILEIGFYLVDENGNVKTKDVRSIVKDEDGKRTVVHSVEPIRFRTYRTALDVACAMGGECAVLGVAVENFAWGE